MPLLNCPFGIARSGLNVGEQGNRAGRCPPPTRVFGPQQASFASLPAGRGDRVCLKALCGTFSLRGFGLNHPEVLLKLQESGCPFCLVKVGAASGFPLVRQESRETLLT